MKTTWFAGCCFFLASALSYGADVGVVTLLDGNVRLLRGVSWYRLVEGARVQDGDIIDAEDRGHPYSDQEIVEKLRQEHGIILARRTVAKYREELSILPARLRKHS